MSDDTRKDQRVKVQTLKAKYKSATIDEFIEQYAVDISRGGIFIKTPKPAATGTLLKIEIQLRDASPVISAVGRVVWRREAPEGGQAAGMGIKFIKVDEASQAVIERIVSVKGEGAGPHFDSIPPPAMAETTGPVAGKTNSDFFGSTNPEAEMPAAQDRTMMRQMSAFLGEALRSTGAEEEARPAAAAPAPAAAPTPRATTKKATIIGMPTLASQQGSAPVVPPVAAAAPPIPAATAAPAAPARFAGGTTKKGTMIGMPVPNVAAPAPRPEPAKPAAPASPIAKAEPPKSAAASVVAAKPAAASPLVAKAEAPKPAAAAPGVAAKPVGLAKPDGPMPPLTKPDVSKGFDDEGSDQPTTVSNRSEIERLLRGSPVSPPLTASELEGSDRDADSEELEPAADLPEPLDVGATVPFVKRPLAGEDDDVTRVDRGKDLLAKTEADVPPASESVSVAPPKREIAARSLADIGRAPDDLPKKTVAKAPVVVPSKKSNTGLMVGVAAVLAVTVGGGWWYLQQQKQHAGGAAVTADADAGVAPVAQTNVAVAEAADAGHAAMPSAAADSGAVAMASPDVVAAVPEAAVAAPSRSAVVNLRGLPPGAEVFVDGAPVTIDVDHVNIAAGRAVHVRARVAGYQDQEQTVHAANNAVTTLTFAFVHPHPAATAGAHTAGTGAHPTAAHASNDTENSGGTAPAPTHDTAPAAGGSNGASGNDHPSGTQTANPSTTSGSAGSGGSGSTATAHPAAATGTSGSSTGGSGGANTTAPAASGGSGSTTGSGGTAGSGSTGTTAHPAAGTGTAPAAGSGGGTTGTTAGSGATGNGSGTASGSGTSGSGTHPPPAHSGSGTTNSGSGSGTTNSGSGSGNSGSGGSIPDNPF